MANETISPVTGSSCSDLVIWRISETPPELLRNIRMFGIGPDEGETDGWIVAFRGEAAGLAKFICVGLGSARVAMHPTGGGVAIVSPCGCGHHPLSERVADEGPLPPTGTLH